MRYSNIKTISRDGKVDVEHASPIDSLLELFDMHNLIPKVSHHDNVYANCLAMLVASIDWIGNIKHLFESLPYTIDREIDLLDILNTLSYLGHTSHKMVVNLDEIDDRLMPCLFIPEQPNNAAPIVILKKEGNKINAFNSQTKQIVRFNAKQIQGVAYFFEKMNMDQVVEENETRKNAGMSWFSVLMTRFKPVMQEIIIVSIFINIFALAMPIFTMSIYDIVIASGSTKTLMALLTGVLISIVGETLLRIVRLKSIVWLGVRLDNIVSNTIFERLLLMRAIYTEGASISDQVSRIKTFESLRKFFTGPLFLVVIELPFTLILVTAIWFIAGPLAYIPIIVMVLFSFLLFYYQYKIRVASRASARSSSYKQQQGMETFIKMSSLHHNGMTATWLQQYKEKLSDAVIKNFRSGFISSITEVFAHSISMISGVAVVVFGVYLIWEKQITIGALVATMILIWRILGPLQTLCSMLPRIEQLKNSINQINKLTNIEIEYHPTLFKKTIEHSEGHIKLTNVGLRYSTEIEPVFVGLDIDVKPGEVIGITGINGSGKSSLLKLINGLYRPQTGTVRIDNINIKQMYPAEIRNYIAYLPQAPNFFTGTIKENLLLVNPLASDSDIEKALKHSTAKEEVENLKDGLNTVIYGNNPHLTSSLIYSLNLARVFLKKESNIVLLDELPNSVLNMNAGGAYKKLLTEAKGKRTVFFISQREDYLKLADRIILLKSGNRPLIMKSKEFIKNNRN